MKYDELMKYGMDDPTIGDDYEMYRVAEVDAAIAELKAENQRLVKCCKEYDSRQRIDERIKFNGYQQLRATKRALWLARAKRATEKADSFIDIKVTYCGVCNINHSVYPEKNARRMLTCDEWIDVWTNVWEKCLNKAEKYK